MRQKHANIATLELIPIVIAVVVWGQPGRGRQSFADRCDNQAVVYYKVMQRPEPGAPLEMPVLFRVPLPILYPY